MDWNGCLSLMQGYLENSPLVVLGSGASIPYGLPSMSDLAAYIKSNSTVMSDPNYGAFCAALNSEGLEKAIDLYRYNKPQKYKKMIFLPDFYAFKILKY